MPRLEQEEKAAGGCGPVSAADPGAPCGAAICMDFTPDHASCQGGSPVLALLRPPNPSLRQEDPAAFVAARLRYLRAQAAAYVAGGD